ADPLPAGSCRARAHRGPATESRRALWRPEAIPRDRDTSRRDTGAHGAAPRRGRASRDRAGGASLDLADDAFRFLLALTPAAGEAAKCDGGGTRVHRLVFVIVGAGLVSVVLALLRFGSAGLFTLALAAPVFDERWIAPWYAVPAIEEVGVPVGAATLRADLYRPRNLRAAVLLVHGLSPAGKRHPQLVRLARVFTRQGFMVMVPHFDGLAMFRLTGREID